MIKTENALIMDPCYKQVKGGLIMSEVADKMLKAIHKIMEEEHCDIHEATNIWLERLVDEKYKEQASN